MTDLRPVILVAGVLVAALGLSMVLPMATDLTAQQPAHRANWSAFAISGLICLMVGGGMAAASWGGFSTITVRQGFLLTALSWFLLVVFAALPLRFSILGMDYTDAFFEAMSGITTTGATVITTLDTAPPGLLLWRSMLQWFGGVGIIIMAFAVLPALRVGGMQIFKSEAWDTTEKFIANATQYSIYLSGIYVFFTILCFISLWLAGLSGFDALNHAMTSVATGGFSTRDASIGAFIGTGRFPLDLILTFFMLIGSLPFGIFLIAALRGNFTRLVTDSQIRFFLITVAVITAAMFVQVLLVIPTDLFTAFRLAVFNVTSIISGTGYATTDYGAWGPFAVGVFFCIMFIGGCAGSTSCGMKIFRLQVALAAVRQYGRQLSHPHAVLTSFYNGRPLTREIFISVLSFFFIYFASFATLAVLLSGFGLDPLTAISAAGSAIANVGPGLGPIVGPAGNYASLDAGVKWLLSAGMLLGRLEFFTILVLFSPAFWRD